MRWRYRVARRCWPSRFACHRTSGVIAAVVTLYTVCSGQIGSLLSPSWHRLAAAAWLCDRACAGRSGGAGKPGAPVDPGHPVSWSDSRSRVFSMKTARKLSHCWACAAGGHDLRQRYLPADGSPRPERKLLVDAYQLASDPLVGAFPWFPRGRLEDDSTRIAPGSWTWRSLFRSDRTNQGAQPLSTASSPASGSGPYDPGDVTKSISSSTRPSSAGSRSA